MSALSGSIIAEGMNDPTQGHNFLMRLGVEPN